MRHNIEYLEYFYWNIATYRDWFNQRGEHIGTYIGGMCVCVCVRARALENENLIKLSYQE